MSVRSLLGMLQDSEVLWELLGEIAFVNEVFNSVNFEHVDSLFVPLRLLVALSPLFLEDDNLLSPTDLFHSGVHLALRNGRSTDSRVVFSAYEEDIVNANLSSDSDFTSQDFSHDSVVFHNFVLDSLEADHSVDATRLDGQGDSLFGVVDDQNLLLISVNSGL